MPKAKKGSNIIRTYKGSGTTAGSPTVYAMIPIPSPVPGQPPKMTKVNITRANPIPKVKTTSVSVPSGTNKYF